MAERFNHSILRSVRQDIPKLLRNGPFLAYAAICSLFLVPGSWYGNMVLLGIGAALSGIGIAFYACILIAVKVVGVVEYDEPRGRMSHDWLRDERGKQVKEEPIGLLIDDQ